MKNNNSKAIGFVVALFAILAIALIAIKPWNKGGNDLPLDLTEIEVSNEAVIYLDGDTYHYKNQDKDIAFDKITEGSDFEYSNITISPDGKYGYYFTTFDGINGKLRIAELKKLKEDKDNSGHIFDISDNANFNYVVIPSGVLYTEDGTKLYYYKDKESLGITDKLTDFRTDGQSIIYETMVEDKPQLYSLSASFDSAPVLIAENYTHASFLDNGTIVIAQQVDKTNSAVGIYSKESGVITLTEATDFYKEFPHKNIFYYTVESENKVTLDTFVKDEYEEEDKLIVKPEKDEYSDKEEYYKVREKYDDAVKRIELREALKTTNFPVRALYKYVDGNATLIADNVVTVKSTGKGRTGTLLYTTVDSIKGNIKINSIFSCDDLIETIKAEENNKELYVTSPTGYTGKLSEEISEVVSKDIENTEIYATDTGFYAIETPENELFYIEADDKGEFSELKFIENNSAFSKSRYGEAISYEDNIYYYSLDASDEVKDFEDRTGALMVYNAQSEDKTEVFGADSRVLLNSLNLYNNGVIYFCKTDEENKNVGLYKLDNGAESLVADKLNRYGIYKNAMVTLADGKISFTYVNDFINAQPEALSEPVGTDVVAYGTNMLKEDFRGSNLRF